MSKILLVVLCVALATGEPPAPRHGGHAQLAALSAALDTLGGTPSASYGAPSASYGPPSGYPRQTRPSAAYGVPGYEEPANYEFKYDVDEPEYNVNFGHQEARQGDVAQGEYYVLLPDGRTQHVAYVADQDGYRPKISYQQGQAGYGRGPAHSHGGY